MVDVYIVTLSLVGILITLPALMMGINLMLPGVTQRTETRLAETPGKSFVMGTIISAALLLFMALISQVSYGPVRLIAFVSAAIGMGIGIIGAAGMARVFAARLAPLTRSTSTLANLVRGAIVYELACLFPIVGWFLFLPVAGATAMGAAVFGLLGWLPQPRVIVGVQSSISTSTSV